MMDHAQALPGKMLSGEIKQLGYIVEDIERGMHVRTQQMGLGPWTCKASIANCPLILDFAVRSSCGIWFNFILKCTARIDKIGDC